MCAQTIGEDTTWLAAESPFLVTNLSISADATLTIEEGVEVRLNPGGVMSVQSGGTLVVSGTSDDPVLFTSASATPMAGDWQCLIVNLGGSAQVAHAIFEYGGSNSQQGGLVSTYSSDVTLTDCVIRHSTYDGFVVQRSGTDGVRTEPTLSNVEIHDCGRHGISLAQQHPHGSQSQFSGLNIHDCSQSAISVVSLMDAPWIESAVATNNGYDGVEVGATGWATVRDHHLSGALEWRVHQFLVGTGSTVTVGAGARVLLRKSTSEHIVYNGGALIVEGTVEHPVLFSSAKATPAVGDWIGFMLRSGSSADIRHAIFEYGGTGSSDGAGNGLLSVRSSDVLLEDVELRHAASVGVHVMTSEVANTSVEPVLRNILAHHCPLAGLYFVGQQPMGSRSIVDGIEARDCGAGIRVGSFDDIPEIRSANFTDNGFNGVDIPQANRATRDFTLIGDVDWRLGSLVLSGGVAARIEAGATVYFLKRADSYYVLEIPSGSGLFVEGTAEKPVLLTSAADSPAAGDWHNFDFQRNSTGRFSHCRIEYNRGFNIATPDFEMRDTTIDHVGDTYGVYYALDSQAPWGHPLFQNLTVSNCTGHALTFPVNLAMMPIMDGLVLEGNPANAIYLGSSTGATVPPEAVTYLSSPGFPYRGGGAYVSSGQVSIAPGTVFELSQSLTVQNGRLTALGTADSPIIFRDDPTSSNSSAAITLNNSGHAVLEHCIVEKRGGFSLLDVSGSPWNDTTYLEARNCVFSGAATGSGVSISTANARFQNCDFSNNARHGVDANSSYAGFGAVFENCQMTSNQMSGAYVFGPQRLVNCDLLGNGESGIVSFPYSTTPADQLPVFEFCRVTGNTKYGVENLTSFNAGKMVARNFWWGDPSGPFHPTLNPEGLGDAVSNNVIFTPWATSPDGGVQETQPIALEEIVSATTDSSDLYVLTLLDGEAANLMIRLSPTTGVGNWRLTQRSGQPPTAGMFDREGIPRDGTLEILIPSPGAGIHFIAVSFLGEEGTSGSYQLECTSVNRSLTRIESSQAGNAGLFTQQVHGCGFVAGMTVELLSGGTQLASYSPSSYSATTLLVPMDLTGLTPGVVDVAAVWPDAAREILSGVFEITAGQGSDLWASFRQYGYSETYRLGRTHTRALSYGNKGDADATPAILVITSSADDTHLRATLEEEGGPGNLQVLAIGPSADVGSVPPGFERNLDLYFEKTTEVDYFHFTLDIKEGDNAPIDWESQRSDLRPAEIDESTWNSIWPALKSNLGATSSDHIAMLTEIARRLARRGSATPDPAWSVSHLIDFEARRLAGAPVGAISGRLLLMPYGRPQPSAAVKLYDSLNPDAEPRVVRTNGLGEFCFNNLPDGDYELYVNDYFLDAPVSLAILAQQDVTGLDIPIHDEDPTPAGPDNALLGHSPSLVSGSTGMVHLVWENSGELYSLAWENSTWKSPATIADASGASPHVLYDANLFGAGQPGLLAVWETMDDNGVNTLAWSAGKWTAGAYQWTIPEALTSDANDDLSPRLTRAPDGTWRVMWLQRANGIADDTDLYMTLLDPSTAGEWFVPPVVPDGLSRDICDSFNFATKVEIPKALQEVFGKRYAAEVGFELCEGDKTCQEFKKSGGANLAIELGDSLKGTATGTMQSSYRLTCKPCRYMPWTMQMSVTGGLEADFARPVPIIIGGVPVGVAKFSIPVAVQMKAGLHWRHEFTGLPDAGFIGMDCIAGGRVVVEDNLGIGKGQGDLSIAGSYQWNTNEGFKVDGACVTLSGEAAIFGGFAKRKFSKQWGDACGRSVPTFGERSWSNDKVLHYSRTYLEDDIVIVELLETVVEPSTGTGGVYEGTPALSGIAVDLHDDGRPSVLRNGGTGESFMIWAKDVGDYANGLGNQIVFAVDVGTGWSAPEPIQATRHFNRDPEMLLDSAGNLFAVWSQASAAGLDETSSIALVDAAAKQSHIVFSRRVAGVWSEPVAIGSLSGRNEQPAIARIGTKIFAVWVQRVSDNQSNIMSSTWDGTAWGAPSLVSSSAWSDRPALATMDSLAMLVWAEDEDGNLDTTADTRLRYATTGSGTWSAATYIPATMTSQIAATKSPLKTQTREDILRFQRAIPRPPENCCGDECKPTYKKPRPKTPPPPMDELDRAGHRPVVPIDPNEKQAPLGWGAYHIIERGDELIYTILFENKPEATAPAQDVFITDDLAADIDWTTFQIHSLGWGEEQLNFPNRPAAIDEYVSIADYRADIGTEWLVNIRGALDQGAGRVTFTFRTLDPVTEEAPMDALAGFLPPNDETHRGEGFVVFSVKPKADTAEDLTVTIRNIATIIFDLENPIITNEVQNAVGDIPVLWAAVLSGILAVDEATEPTDINADGAIDVGDLLGR